MRVQYDPVFVKKLKTVNVRVRKSFEDRIRIFLKDPYDPELNNHLLHDPYIGYRSIDITADYRAVYEEIVEREDVLIYFTMLGTHKELFGNPPKEN